jgi:hypothetical protein
VIEDVFTGRIIRAEVRPVDAADLRRLGAGWRFDWRSDVLDREVFKLVDPKTAQTILGLVALKRCDGYVEVTLLESHPSNVGRTKRFRGIPGSLFAFAAKLSFEHGGGGFLVMDAKSELLEHYQRMYGFERVGRSQRMVLTTAGAMRLIAEYDRGPDHE